jgi:glycosyltransferase involved in cell wall biosynthesis
VSIDSTVQEKMQQLKCCVLVPTYNNGQTLEKVLKDILKITQNLIVVNDGATDQTASILENFQNIERIDLPKNKGKGNALKVGFEKAIEKGFDHALTIDSDGQHFPEDIPVFLDALEKENTKNVLYIGARNMSQEGIPGGSSFGNKFSNFWFWFETGIKLKDTQSGFRLYPLKAIEKLKLYTPKFEFEIEVIVKAAWSGTLVKNVPIQVFYEDENRVSHFRKVPDFARISILNTWFVLVALFWIKPRDLYRKYRKKGFRRFVKEDLLYSSDSPRKKALSIALGVFIGLCPLWGFHTVIVLFLAVLFKLNKVISFAFSNISLAPFVPFVLYASLRTGTFITGEELNYTFDSIVSNFEFITHLKTYIIGSLTLSVLGAFFFGSLGYLIFNLFDRKKVAVHNG